MKKLLLVFAAVIMTVSASAQTVTESKTFDNFYIGINGGVATKTTHNSWLSGLNPEFGLRIGRNFTPVVGVAVEGNAYFSNKPYESYGTAVRMINVGVLGTLNLNNWFSGYKGEPRSFEVIPVAGFGWGHAFGDGQANYLTSKTGIDFTFNLGAKKAWQVYIEPAMVWALTYPAGVDSDGNTLHKATSFNLSRSMFKLSVGVVYKFKNSNGTHNFTIAELRDQAEIDALNAQINSLRNALNAKDAELAAKDRQIADLQKALDECNSRPVYEKPATATNLQPTVLFRQGKSTVDKSQQANVEMIAQYMKNHPEATVEIKGYASPEGSAELNQKLSEDRAAAVKNMLVKTYKISEDRLTTQGMGATDKLFEQVEFNRVATFNDSSKAE